jgi:hypothetical protein
VKLQRVYFDCRRCAAGEYAADSRLGIEGGQTRQARRLLCLAGSSWSFAASSTNLLELCGLEVAPGTVRNVCQAEAGRVEHWQSSAPEATAPYAKAAGEIEFYTDGTCVNTTAGWKEMRLGVFTKRPRGEPAAPDEWDQRRLPSPTARHVFAAIESAAAFATRWPLIASRLGIRNNRRIDVVADGARWIWDRVAFHWTAAVGTLDIYHALEHITAAGQALHGEQTAATRHWIEHARTVLLQEGHPGMHTLLAQSRLIAVRAGQRRGLGDLEHYLRSHAEHLGYAGRLAEGRVIGSGQVEGACKHWIGRRLKQTGARWDLGNVNDMAQLCCLTYSDHWDLYWASPN